MTPEGLSPEGGLRDKEQALSADQQIIFTMYMCYWGLPTRISDTIDVDSKGGQAMIFLVTGRKSSSNCESDI